MNILLTKDKFECNIRFYDINISIYNQRQKELEIEISSSFYECHKNIHPLYHPTTYLTH